MYITHNVVISRYVKQILMQHRINTNTSYKCISLSFSLSLPDYNDQAGKCKNIFKLLHFVNIVNLNFSKTLRRQTLQDILTDSKGLIAMSNLYLILKLSVVKDLE